MMTRLIGVDGNGDEVKETGSCLTTATKPTFLKHKRELPLLASKFLGFYESVAQISTNDDPSLHGGRNRSTSHLEGR